MKFLRHYIEIDGKPVSEPDPIKFAAWLIEADRLGTRRVDETAIGDVWISTVFLGLDHRFRPEIPHELYETMIFGGELDLDCHRYATRTEAMGGHMLMVERVRKGKGGGDD